MEEELDLTGESIIDNDTQSEDVDNESVDITGEEAVREETDITGNDEDQEGEEVVDEDEVQVLEEGTELEYEGVTYYIDADGNVVDENGEVFVNAEDVPAWLDEVNIEHEGEDGAETEFDIEAIQDAIGLDIVDEDGNVLEFTNDIEGVKAYVDAVINYRSEEIQEGAINKLFVENPMLEDFINYVSINNGDPRGFGEVRDRSGVELDPDNDNQLEYVIRVAAREFGNTSLSDSYIQYLRDNGGLYEEAEKQLAALVEKDKANREELSRRAEEAKAREAEELSTYWDNVSEAIDNRVIGGFRLPESFVREINGQKYTFTPDDFYSYLSRGVEADESGRKLTGYQRDLNNLTSEELLNRELLDAWLMFTGGTYEDLIDMAVKEDKVKTLKLKAKQLRNTGTVKIKQPRKTDGIDLNDLVLS